MLSETVISALAEKIIILEAEILKWRIVDDGHGSKVKRCCPGCNLHVVRPGKFECDCKVKKPDEYGRIQECVSSEARSNRFV